MEVGGEGGRGWRRGEVPVCHQPSALRYTSSSPDSWLYRGIIVSFLVPPSFHAIILFDCAPKETENGGTRLGALYPQFMKVYHQFQHPV